MAMWPLAKYFKHLFLLSVNCKSRLKIFYFSIVLFWGQKVKGQTQNCWLSQLRKFPSKWICSLEVNDTTVKLRLKCTVTATRVYRSCILLLHLRSVNVVAICIFVVVAKKGDLRWVLNRSPSQSDNHIPITNFLHTVESNVLQLMEC